MQTEQDDYLKEFRPKEDWVRHWQKSSRRRKGKRGQRTATMRFRQYIGVIGCYLIHFKEPLGRARHYLGMSGDIAERLVRHAKGKGAAIMRAVKKKGIEWDVVRDWRCETIYDAEQLEKSLKGNSTRNCPVCTEGAGR